MLEDLRRELYERYIRAAMGSEDRNHRIVTFSWPPEDESERDTTLIIIDGISPGSVDLSVRSRSFSSRKVKLLTDVGFKKKLDDDEPQYLLYQRTVTSASVKDAITFVEWVFLCVVNAPDDYTPGIRSPGAGEEGGKGAGCFKSCVTIIQIGFVILFVAAVVAALLFS
jgi:hypothetical protein